MGKLCIFHECFPIVIHDKSSVTDRQRFDADPDLDLDLFYPKIRTVKMYLGTVRNYRVAARHFKHFKLFLGNNIIDASHLQKLNRFLCFEKVGSAKESYLDQDRHAMDADPHLATCYGSNQIRILNTE